LYTIFKYTLLLVDKWVMIIEIYHKQHNIYCYYIQLFNLELSYYRTTVHTIHFSIHLNIIHNNELQQLYYFRPYIENRHYNMTNINIRVEN